MFFPRNGYYVVYVRKHKEVFWLLFPITAKTLMVSIEKKLADRSIIFKNCWKGYKTDTLRDDSYEHFTVNHKRNLVYPNAGGHNKKQCGTVRRCLQSYLIEFMRWRLVIYFLNDYFHTNNIFFKCFLSYQLLCILHQWYLFVWQKIT